MSRRQQLEISKVRGQNQRALARIFPFELVPDVDPIVSDPAPEPAIKKSAEPDVLRRGPAEILVRLNQDLLALVISTLGKRYFEIAYPYPRVTLVEMKGEPSAADSERTQDEVGKDAQRMDYRNQYPEDHAILRPELKRGALRDSARERKIRRLRRPAPGAEGRRPAAEPGNG